MLAEERFALILEQLNEQRTVTVQQLLLNVMLN